MADVKYTFRNPILGGDYPDPTIIRSGEDYYMTHSAFNYLPGLTIFHSRDLVNWQPVSVALTRYLGSVWAPDICKYQESITFISLCHRVMIASAIMWFMPIHLRALE